MEREEEEKKHFAVLIDADNISEKYASSIFNEIADYGYASYRRIYGNWAKGNGWKEDTLLENSINPIQQFNYTIGKNATDMAMVIDDSTVTPISEIEESIITFVQNNENKGKPTYLGEVGSRLCDKFIEFDARNYGYTKLVTLLKDKCPKLVIKQEGTSYQIELKEQTEPENLEKEIIAFLKRNGGKVDNLSLVLEQLKKKHPNFNLNDYGYSRISSFLRSFDKITVHGNALMLKETVHKK